MTVFYVDGENPVLPTNILRQQLCRLPGQFCSVKEYALDIQLGFDNLHNCFFGQHFLSDQYLSQDPPGLFLQAKHLFELHGIQQAFFQKDLAQLAVVLIHQTAELQYLSFLNLVLCVQRFVLVDQAVMLHGLEYGLSKLFLIPGLEDKSVDFAAVNRV